MNALQSFLEKTWYYNTLEAWAISFLFILGGFVFARILYWILNTFVKKAAANTNSRLDDILVDKLEEPIAYSLVILGIWWGFERLDFPASFQDWMNKVYHILIAINITWLFARLVDALIAEYLVPMAEKSDNKLDDQVMPLIKKGLKWAIWTLGIIVALNNAGYNVGALLAGLGIGGIALAMAAKDFVSNIFGGITVFVDKPFRINDRIEIGGNEGFVREIGIRSTKIETLAGRLITIPNHKFTDSFVQNISAEPSRKVILELGLTYDTPPEKMQEAMDILREIVLSLPMLDDNAVIGFSSFGDFSLGITCIYYIRIGELIIESSSALNMEILKRFNEAQLDFAFPTQTILTKQG